MHSIKNLRRRILAWTTGGLDALAMAGATAVTTTSAGIGPCGCSRGDVGNRTRDDRRRANEDPSATDGGRRGEAALSVGSAQQTQRT